MCMVEYPRWFRRVLRAVGLIGDGEMGVRGVGTEGMVRLMGDLRESEGRVEEWVDVAVAADEMLMESLGLRERDDEESMVVFGVELNYRCVEYVLAGVGI